MPVIAARKGLLLCHSCELLNRPLAGAGDEICARCGASLHLRKPASIERTTALLAAAAILYIPANVLPVMITGSLFGQESDTILSGVIYLWDSGSWPLAMLIFFASITVPLCKLIALTALLVSVKRRSTWHPTQRTRLYRVVEFIGRWSMVDIYVAGILVALVQFKALATIRPGPGAIAFGAVVVLTMLASKSFDPRLIWDPVEGYRG